MFDILQNWTVEKLLGVIQPNLGISLLVLKYLNRFIFHFVSACFYMLDKISLLGLHNIAIISSSLNVNATRCSFHFISPFWHWFMLCRGCCCCCLPLHPFGCSLWMFVCWMNWMKLAWRFWMSRVGFRTRFVFNKIAIRIHKAFHMIFSSIELNYGLRFITSVQFRMLFTQQPSWKVLTLIHNLQYIWFNLHFYIFHFSILIIQ